MGWGTLQIWLFLISWDCGHKRTFIMCLTHLFCWWIDFVRARIGLAHACLCTVVCHSWRPAHSVVQQLQSSPLQWVLDDIYLYPLLIEAGYIQGLLYPGICQRSACSTVVDDKGKTKKCVRYLHLLFNYASLLQDITTFVQFWKKKK